MRACLKLEITNISTTICQYIEIMIRTEYAANVDATRVLTESKLFILRRHAARLADHHSALCGARLR